MNNSQLRIAALGAALTVACFGAPANAAPMETPPSFGNPAAPANSAAAALAPGTIVPFQKSVYINIANGSAVGSDNGDITGAQTVVAPAGGKLVIQTVSIYRSGAAPSSTMQAFVNVSFAGQYNAFAFPACIATAASFAGVTLTGTFYAYPTTRILINVFRDTTSGEETDNAVISGYMVVN